jgi:hypothetical protein
MTQQKRPRDVLSASVKRRAHTENHGFFTKIVMFESSVPPEAGYTPKSTAFTAKVMCWRKTTRRRQFSHRIQVSPVWWGGGDWEDGEDGEGERQYCVSPLRQQIVSPLRQEGYVPTSARIACPHFGMKEWGGWGRRGGWRGRGRGGGRDGEGGEGWRDGLCPHFGKNLCPHFGKKFMSPLRQEYVSPLRQEIVSPLRHECMSSLKDSLDLIEPAYIYIYILVPQPFWLKPICLTSCPGTLIA